MTKSVSAEAELTAIALVMATLERDAAGCSYLLRSLETTDQLRDALGGVVALAASVAESAYDDPQRLCRQWARLVAAELDITPTSQTPPRNAEQRRRDKDVR
jgi:hypothetical protein